MSASYDNLVLSDPALASYWKIDEPSGTNVADSKGSVTGTMNGPVVRGQPGLLVNDDGTSALFDNAAGDKFDTSPNPYSFLDRAAFSVEVWVYLRAYNAASGHVLINNSDGGINGWCLQLLNPAVLIEFKRGDGSGADLVGNTVLETTMEQQVSHIVATYDGTNMTVYRNGAILAGPTTSTRNVSSYASPYVAVGAAVVGGSGFDGWMEKVAVYTAALSSTDVTQHYSTGMAQDGAATTPFLISGRGASW